MKTRTSAFAIGSLFAFLSTASAFATSTPAPETLSRAEVESIIKDYLVKNPEVIVEAMKNYQQKAEQAEQQKTQAALETNKAELFSNPGDPVAGNPAGDVTLVEFFDYHCGYCKHLLPAITQLLKEDTKLKVVFKELPILTDDSKLAAKAALAVNEIAPKKYFEYHTALMGMSGQYTEDNLAEAAKKLGIDEKKFRETIKNSKLDAALDKNTELARTIGLRGTPAIILNDHFIPGAASLEDLKDAIQKQRSGGGNAKPAAAK